MHDKDIGQVIELLTEESKNWEVPVVTVLAREKRSPFAVLISTLLSLRTKDETTAEATMRLFQLAVTPAAMLRLSPEEIEQAIYPVGFYRNKSRTMLAICHKLVDHFDSKVPDRIEELLTLPGVGRKTANLVVTLGYAKEGICVDTHVHRISNRLGYVATTSPEQTEFALRGKLPRKYWIDYNTLMVAFGRSLCRPLSPYCSRCPVAAYCARAGVTRTR